MELALHEAETRRLSELVTAAENGERVISTRHGEPAVELVRCDHKRGGIDFGKLESEPPKTWHQRGRSEVAGGIQRSVIQSPRAGPE